MHNTEAQKKKLTFYDSKGRRQERRIEADLYDRILKIFDGNPKGVLRTGGGIGVAVPRAIKFKKQQESTGQEEALLIWMNCKDFTSSAEKAFECSLNRPKLVPMMRVLEGFSLSTDLDQRYVIDLGEGIVPVHVIKLVPSLEKPMAAFLDFETARSLLFAKKPALKAAQLYWAPQECLRLATKVSKDSDDFEKAIAHFQKKYLKKHQALPSVLRLGDPVSIPRSANVLTVLEEHITQCLSTKARPEMDSTRTIQLSEGGLLPFGLLDEGT